MEGSSVVPLRIGSWCVNPLSGQISRDGEIIRVEARTMRLLLCLAGRPGEVVSIDELLDHVWSGVIVTPDSVYQAIASLRRLLGDDPKQPSYIATVPRLGYRMVAAVSPWVDSPLAALTDVPPVEIPAATTDAPSPPSHAPSPAPVAEAETTTRRTRRRVPLIALGSAALVLLAAMAYLLASHHEAPALDATSASAQPTQQSIGVMPFLDLTEGMEREYFADGMTEQLIDMLSKVPGLRVPARTSSFYFKDKQVTIAEIAKTLHVDYVLEGSVRKSGKTLRITAQLIRADTGFAVWSDTYDRSLDDMLMIQDDIANEVKKALIASLEHAAQPATATPASPAYATYFQARALRRDDLSKEQAQTIVDYLHQAIRLDPAYAPAWAELARTLAYQSFHQLVPPGSVSEEAHHAANQALKLGPAGADAHLAMGIVHGYLDWDWLSAGREYQSALALQPGNAEIYALLSDARRSTGNIDEALSLMQRAVELDPLDGHDYQQLGEMYYSLGKLGDAETNIRKALDIHPELPLHGLLGEIKLAQGDQAAALEAAQNEKDDRARSEGLALVYFATGRKAEADAALTSLETGHANDSAYAIARIHAYRKDVDQAFAWLDRALQQHDPDGIHVMSDPLLKSLHGDSRYKAFLQKMKLA